MIMIVKCTEGIVSLVVYIMYQLMWKYANFNVKCHEYSTAMNIKNIFLTKVNPCLITTFCSCLPRISHLLIL